MQCLYWSATGWNDGRLYSKIEYKCQLVRFIIIIVTQEMHLFS